MSDPAPATPAVDILEIAAVRLSLATFRMNAASFVLERSPADEIEFRVALVLASQARTDMYAVKRVISHLDRESNAA